MFFCDVFVRRVMIGFDWVRPLLMAVRDRLLGRPAEPAKDERLERLRTRKAEVGSQIDDRRAAARFEPLADADTSLDTLDQTDRRRAAPGAAAAHRRAGRARRRRGRVLHRPAVEGQEEGVEGPGQEVTLWRADPVVRRLKRRTGGPPVSNDVSRLFAMKESQASRLSYDASDEIH